MTELENCCHGVVVELLAGVMASVAGCACWVGGGAEGVFSQAREEEDGRWDGLDDQSSLAVRLSTCSHMVPTLSGRIVASIRVFRYRDEGIILKALQRFKKNQESWNITTVCESSIFIQKCVVPVLLLLV